VTPPRVSVLIPCHNAQAYIAETLDSVLRQTWANLQVIVVDDGSSDGSAAIVEGFADRGVRLVRQARRGAAAARNRAYQVSDGDFVQFLDADDLIDPDKIALQMARLAGRRTAVASAQWGRFGDDPAATVFAPESNWEDLPPVEWLLRSRQAGEGMLFPALWLVPRPVAAAAGPWDESLSLNDDGEYFTRVVLAADQVLFCRGARCRYRSGVAGSLSGSKNWRSGFAAIDLCERHVRARDDGDRARRTFALSWQHLAHASYPYEPAIARRALARAKALHPVRIRPGGGVVFRTLSRLIGWRAARRLQIASGRV
jgi:glycosyltransferase involved in cell wall biosynthesis